MNPLLRLAPAFIGVGALAASAHAQVPDLLNALDAGGRAMATGGANASTNIDSLAIYNNPAALGYLGSGEVGLVYRNLPESRSTFSGDLDSPDVDSDGRSGNPTITHAGYATPVRTLFGRGSGTLGISYTVGGYINDTATAGSLTQDGNTISNYRLDREARATFFNLSYGKALSSSFSYGVGLVVASQKLDYSETGTLTAGGVPVPIDNGQSSTDTGVGVLVGALYTPTNSPMSFGLSYRSPISLSGDNSEYDRIPGRLLAGATYRKDGFRGSKDYLLLGAQITQIFDGGSSRLFDRDAQTLFGFGAEYNVGLSQGRVPLRVGFTTVPSAGDGYGSRNAATFGFGLRPNRYPVGLDFSWAVPESGGYDFSIAASYRFK